MSLSVDQKQIFDEYKKGSNIFITGLPGSGKTYILKKIIEDAKNNDKNIAVTSMTGCSSILLGRSSTTLHSFAGIGLANRNDFAILKSITRNPMKRNRWLNTDILIIDELSMMSSKILELLNYIAKRIRMNSLLREHPDIFGGIQLIFSADFFQLPPISRSNSDIDYCFNSSIWNDLFDIQILMDSSFRHINDKVYSNILDEIRYNELSDESFNILKSRLNKKPENNIKPIYLFPTKYQVNKINNMEISRLYGKEYISTVKNIYDTKYIDKNFKHEIDMKNIKHNASISEKNYEYKTLLKNSLFEEKLVLKQNCKVMCIRNISLDEGIVNGSIGTVINFTTINHELLGNISCPIVKFNNGITMTIEPSISISTHIYGIFIAQIPLILGYALSIHKSQGVTLDNAYINIDSRVFTTGQSYVALSRVKTLDGLYLLGIDRDSFVTDPRVIEFYDRFYE